MRLLVVLGLALAVGGGIAKAQNESAAGCTLEKQIYTCNWQAFRSRLDAAHTVSVETERMDRFAAAQLRKLAAGTGKSVAAPGQTRDLTFLLIPLEPTGIHLGPSGEPLATLRIYAPGPGTTRGTLLWAETYKGAPDRPWPATVDGLIDQFKRRLSSR